MSSRRTLAVSTLLAAAALLGAGWSLDLNKITDTIKDAGKVAKGVAGIGPEEERVIGQSVAVEVVGTYGGLVRDAAVNRRVDLIGRTLAACSDRPGLDWRFGVLASDDVNAFSAPGGYVFITRGLYRMAADDDMLAGILAHEIEHVCEKHALSIVARGEFLSGATDIAKNYDSRAADMEAKLQQFDLGIDKITKTLFTVGFDPQTEYTADRKGRDLAALAGYARDGLKVTLVALQKQPAKPNEKIFSTHPPLADRIKRL